MWNFFKRFFGKFFIWGMVAILISCVLHLKLRGYFMAELASDVFSTIGVALLLGSIFDFAKNSEDYTRFISNTIKDTIITKDFLERLTEEEKKNVLKAVAVPSNPQLEQYSSIGTYYKKSIDSFIDLCKKPFKTNISINIVAKIKDGKVICEGDVSYRRYRVGEKYQPIETSFPQSDSEMINNYILLPDGSRYDLVAEKDIKPADDADLKREKLNKKYFTIIPENLNHHPYITLCKTIKEIGNDHWIAFNWTSLTACDGISFNLVCQDDLIIKTHKVFDNPRLYEINLNEEKSKITIVSTSWLNEYTGFSLIISKK